MKFYHPINGEMSIDTLSTNAMMQLYMISSYVYYQVLDNIMSDEAYDYLCKRMLDKWDEIEHEHKRFVSREDLKAGTGYAIKDYPDRVVIASDMWMRANWENGEGL